MCDKSKLLCNFAQIFIEITDEKKIYTYFMGYFRCRNPLRSGGLLCHLLCCSHNDAEKRGGMRIYARDGTLPNQGKSQIDKRAT